LEAASISPKEGNATGRGAVTDLLSRYGLIALLVAFPLTYAISDLVSGKGLAPIATNLVTGVSNGAIWALIALGYTLVYGIIELINFAHGEVFMIGSLAAFGLYGVFGLTEATGVLGLIGASSWRSSPPCW